MNIPARYCTGYLGDMGVPPPYGPMDFAAWFEAHLGGRWYTFDPRNNVPRIGWVLLARGRDAIDVAITTTFGPNTLVSFKVWTDQVTSAWPERRRRHHHDGTGPRRAGALFWTWRQVFFANGLLAGLPWPCAALLHTDSFNFWINYWDRYFIDGLGLAPFAFGKASEARPWDIRVERDLAAKGRGTRSGREWSCP
jgi:hypothetical protein